MDGAKGSRVPKIESGNHHQLESASVTLCSGAALELGETRALFLWLLSVDCLHVERKTGKKRSRFKRNNSQNRWLTEDNTLW
jgi:hypothetical protein